MEEQDTLFLSIDGYEIEDLEEGDYTAYEQELGVSDRMISGRRVEELRATIWVVEIRYGAISAATMTKLSQVLKAKRQHELFFLPSTGGEDLVSGMFHLVEQPAPSLRRWGNDGPMWQDYTLRFEEINGHD